MSVHIVVASNTQSGACGDSMGLLVKRATRLEIGRF